EPVASDTMKMLSASTTAPPPQLMSIFCDNYMTAAAESTRPDSAFRFDQREEALGVVKSFGGVFAEVFEFEVVVGQPFGYRTHDDRAGGFVG
ncbi:MAG: hypothetical protein MUP13_04615, partial [Thermoanaerobaculales bacterium]|nr:hypothetical protein [Thermoanaerobaculales bacterium]